MEREVEFSKEVRLQLQRHRNTIENISKKAGRLMGVSAIIAAILMGFYGSMSQTIAEIHPSLPDLQIAIPGLFLIIVTIILCIVITRIEVKKEPFLGRILLQKGQDRVIGSWINATEKKYYKKIIMEYVNCLNDAEITIKKMSIWSNISMAIFVTGLTYMLAVILFI